MHTLIKEIDTKRLAALTGHRLTDVKRSPMQFRQDHQWHQVYVARLDGGPLRRLEEIRADLELEYARKHGLDALKLAYDGQLIPL